jgi:hypothetical protein
MQTQDHSVRPLHRACRRVLVAAASALALAGLGGCVVAPYPTAVPVAPSTFDRSFDAALGAMTGQGMSISRQDRGAGVIVGSRGAVALTATVRPQADGTTRVAFDQTGSPSQDPNLVQRVVADYNRLMGR